MKFLESKTCIYFSCFSFCNFKGKIERAIEIIEDELEDRLKELKSQDKFLEAQRLKQRTNFDIEMIREIGYCSGIENYSRILDGRPAGNP